MAYTATSAGTTQLLVPGGEIEFAVLDANETPGGLTKFGITNEFTINIASDKIEKKSARAGVLELVGAVTTSVTRTATLNLAQFSYENLASWLAATKEIQTQTSGSVTNEDIVITKTDASYQIGRTATNPSGVRSITSPTFTIKEGETASGWVTATATALGAFVKQASNPTHYFEATSIGSAPHQTGTPEPTWVTTLGGTTTDGDVTWTCRGLITPVVTTDYTIDLTLARVFIPLTSRIYVGHSLRIDYTKSLVYRETLKTGADVSTTVAIKVIAAPISGATRDWYFPKCTLTPSGDLALYLEEPTFNAMTFDVSILKPSDGPSGEDIAAIYVDGRPVA